MKTILINTQYVENGVTTINQRTISCEEIIDFDFTLTSAQVDKQIDMVFAYARLKCIQVTTDKNMKIETNATDASGGNTINVSSATGFDWDSVSGAVCPFTADVATAYFTNLISSSCTGRVRIGYDNTP